MAMNIRRIVIMAEHRTLRTAAVELQKACGAAIPVVVDTPPQAGDAVLAVISHPVAAPLIRHGWTDLHNTAPAHDAFHVLEREGVLWILGGSARGVMQGVHELTSTLATTDAELLNCTGRFSLPCRVFSPLIGNQLQRDSMTPEIIRSSVRYLGRMGASHVAVTHDFAGDGARDMHSYVESKIFPQASDPARRQRLRASLRAILDAAADFGLDALFDARLFPCQGGPWMPSEAREGFLRRFPAEVLADTGTYQGKVLCFSHPQVQAFYEEIIHSFFADFPEISLFHYLTMDAEGEFCDPERCPRCRGMSRFAQRDRLARFLARALPAARPGVRILNTSFQWDRLEFGIDQMLVRQAALPANVGLCMAATGDSASFERQSHDALREARAATHRAGQLFIGRDALHVFEDVLHELHHQVDYPLGIFAKVRRWVELGADGLYDVRGRLSPADLHANSLACRAALLNPQGDPVAFVRSLTRRWFGETAGQEVASAWEGLERAQGIVSNGYTFPSSSPLSQYVGWHMGKTTVPLPTNPAFTPQPDMQKAPMHGELPPCPASGWIYHEGDYGQRLQAVGQSLLDAAAVLCDVEDRLAKAMQMPMPELLADSEAWLGGGAAVRTADYLQRHRMYIRGLRRFYAYMGPYFLLKSLYLQLDGDTAGYRCHGEGALRAYAQAARALADLLDLYVKEKWIDTPFPAQWSGDNLRGRADQVDAYLREPTITP
jgi:hypothetical protein